MRGVDCVILTEFCVGCYQFKWGCICSDNDDDDDKDVADPIDTTNWKEYAILPYQDRRKFTLGAKFTSWEEQGEFIFLIIDHDDSSDEDDDGDDGDDMQTPSLVEISCNNGQYWIMPMRGTQLVINGQSKTCSGGGRHNSIFRHELNFGDRLEISAEGGSTPASLVFKERTFEPEVGKKDAEPENNAGVGGDASQNVDFPPGRNPLILSKILSYLPIQSLRCARLVCQDWNEQGSRILRRRAYATFNYLYEGEQTTDDVNASMKFYRYIQEMQNLHLSNWYLFLPKFKLDNGFPSPLFLGGSRFNISEHNPGGKYVTDLDWFLHPNRGHQLKILILTAIMASTFDYKIVLKVVAKLQETVEELILEIDLTALVKPTGEEEEYQIATSLNFKKLKTFTFFLNSTSIPDSLNVTSFNLAWLAPWASAIKEIEAIELNGHLAISSFFVKHMQTLGPSEFPKLTKVDTSYVHEAGLVLNFLLGLRQPLKSLSLPKLLKIQDFRNFEKLVDKNANSLESLEFVVSTREDAQSGVNLQLPALPKLRHLDFSVDRGGSDDDESNAKVTLTFPGASINYKAHLPAIRCLIVSPNIEGCAQYWEKYGDFFDNFLPKEQEVCTTLKILDIPVEVGGELYPRAADLLRMFPNVETEFRDPVPPLASSQKNKN